MSRSAIMKRPDSADPVLLTITEDLPPEKFDPLYIRPRGRASPKRLVLRHRPSTARAGTRMSPNDAGQRADVHRVEARIVDEAGCRAVRSLVFSSTASRKERIYRPPQRPVASCVEPDEDPGVPAAGSRFPQDSGNSRRRRIPSCRRCLPTGAGLSGLQPHPNYTD